MHRPFKLVAIGIFTFLIFKGMGWIIGDSDIIFNSSIENAIAQEEQDEDSVNEYNGEVNAISENSTQQQPNKQNLDILKEEQQEILPLEITQKNLESGLVEIPISEYKLLKTLSKRRKELLTLEKTLKLKEDLLNEAQAKFYERIDEFNKNNRQSANKKSKNDVLGDEGDIVKNLIVSYETMKAKDTARIFDELDPILVHKLVSRMNAKKISSIMSKMSTKNVEKLTVLMLQGGSESNMESSQLTQIGR